MISIYEKVISKYILLIKHVGYNGRKNHSIMLYGWFYD